VAEDIGAGGTATASRRTRGQRMRREEGVDIAREGNELIVRFVESARRSPRGKWEGRIASTAP